jgi:hypothetical protein
LQDLGIRNIEIVPVISDINTGIQITRDEFPTAFFDEAGTKEGFQHLENYKKKWNGRDGRWGNDPLKDQTSEGADAFRQWAQAKRLGMITEAGNAWGGTLKYPSMGAYA